MAYQSDIDVQEDLALISMSDSFFERFMTVVKDDERMDLLPTMLKGSYRGLLEFEALISHIAKKMCSESDISYWLYAKSLKKSTFMIFPSGDKSFHVVNNNNYSESVVDSRIFGVIANLMVFSHGSGLFHNKDEALSETLAEHYHALRDAFYNLTESIIYDPASTATDEEKEQVRAMSGAVTSYLD